MSRFIKNTLPYERASGCIFSEQFESNSAVRENGGTLQANAYCEDDAVVLDGTGDNISYPDSDKFSFGNGVSDKPFSISCWIYINSNPFGVIGKGTHNFDCEFALLTGTLGNLIFYLMDESVDNCRIGQRSSSVCASDRWIHIVVTYNGGGESSDMTLYLNGSIFASADSSSNPGSYVAMENLGASLTIGDCYDGSRDANGKIKDLKIWDRELTPPEVEAMYSRTMNKYEDNLVLDLQMDLDSHDPTNDRTLDSSVNKAHATLGAGDGGATTPTKLTYMKGYDFGGGDYLTGDATGLFNSDKISIVCEFWPDFLPSDNVSVSLYDATDYKFYLYKMNNVGSNVLRCNLGGTIIDDIAEATYSPYWRKGRKNIFIITGDSVNNLTNVWLNDGHVTVDDSTAWSSQNPDNYYVGVQNSLSNYFDGKITKLQVYNTVLNEQQVQDILIRSNIELNRTI